MRDAIHMGDNLSSMAKFVFVTFLKLGGCGLPYYLMICNIVVVLICFCFVPKPKEVCFSYIFIHKLQMVY